MANYSFADMSHGWTSKLHSEECMTILHRTFSHLYIIPYQPPPLKHSVAPYLALPQINIISEAATDKTIVGINKTSIQLSHMCIY